MARSQPQHVPLESLAAIEERAPDLITLSSLQIVPETGAEDYFREARGNAAVGKFDPIEVVDFGYLETDWDVGDLVYEAHQVVFPLPTDGQPDASLDGSGSAIPAPGKSSLRASVQRFRREANRRKWLSPKSRLALEKVAQFDVKLSISDLNALEYLFSRAASVSSAIRDIDKIRSHILSLNA